MKVKYLFSLVVAAGFSLVLQGCLPDGPKSDDNLIAQVKQIDDYLQASGAEDVIYDQASGIRFKILEYGDGPVPASTQAIEGTFDGYIFNSSGAFPPFDSDQVDDNLADITPDGLRYIYSVILEGSRARIFLPSNYGYGEAGTADVPGNSILVYDVHLQKVVMTTTQENQYKADTTRIGDYLRESETGFVKKRSGIFFKETLPGTSQAPNPYDVVTMKYTLRVLEQDGPSEKIEENTLTDMPIFQLINGMKIGMPLIHEGGKATIYMPSYLGYGAAKNGSIPANSILIFDIELVSIADNN